MLQRKQQETSQEPRPERMKRTSDGAVTVARKKTGKQRQAIQTKEDDKELEQEYRLLKKLKRGVIDESEYERLTGFASLEEQDSQENDTDAKKHKGQNKSQKSKQRGRGKGPGGKIDLKGFHSKSGFKSKTNRRR